MDEQPECHCEETVIRYKMIKSGPTTYKMHQYQCVRCGLGSRPVKASYAQRVEATPFDESIANAWRESRRQEWERQQEGRQADRDEEVERRRQLYYDHVTMQSPRWRGLRSKVFKRCDGLCEGCGDRPATQVHHLSYANLGDEFLWELAAVCRHCHERFHGVGDHSVS